MRSYVVATEILNGKDLSTLLIANQRKETYFLTLFKNCMNEILIYYY